MLKWLSAQEVFQQVAPDIHEINEKRTKLKKQKTKWSIIAFLIGIIIILLMLRFSSSYSLNAFVIPFAFLGIVSYVFKNKYKTVYRPVFSQVFGAIMNHYNQYVVEQREMTAADIIFKADLFNSINEHDFNKLGLYLDEVDELTKEDEMFGILGKTTFTFSEVEAAYTTEVRGNNGGSYSQRNEVFNGLLFRADFNKSFTHDVKIFSNKKILDYSSEKLGWIKKIPWFAWIPILIITPIILLIIWFLELQFLLYMTIGLLVFAGIFPIITDLLRKVISRKDKVTLEDVEFNRTFTVYCSDQVEARYILTSSFCERLKEVHRRFPNDLRLSFQNGQMALSIVTGRDLFDPTINEEFSFETFSVEYQAFISILLIIEDLDLNTRIWTKS